MRSVPERPVLLSFCVFMGAFVFGPFLGIQLGGHFAPDSELAQVASVFAFPLAFFAGLLFWMGLGVFTVVLGALRNLLRGRLPKAEGLEPSRALVPPGYGSFVVFSLLSTAAAGLLAGAFSDASVAVTLPAYAAAGAVYGLSLWLLAHHGYLPFPEPA